MQDKCNKYESLFIFSSDEKFSEHIDNCVDCKNEYLKMARISELVNEVKSDYKSSSFMLTKLACLLFLFLVGGFGFDALDSRYGYLDVIRYGEDYNISSFGFPADDYGLIQVD